MPHSLRLSSKDQWLLSVHKILCSALTPQIWRGPSDIPYARIIVLVLHNVDVQSLSIRAKPYPAGRFRSHHRSVAIDTHLSKFVSQSTPRES